MLAQSHRGKKKTGMKKQQENEAVVCDAKAVIILLLLLGLFFLGFNFLLCSLREKACVRHLVEVKSQLTEKERHHAVVFPELEEARERHARVEQEMTRLQEELQRLQEVHGEALREARERADAQQRSFAEQLQQAKEEVGALRREIESEKSRWEFALQLAEGRREEDLQGLRVELERAERELAEAKAAHSSTPQQDAATVAFDYHGVADVVEEVAQACGCPGTEIVQSSSEIAEGQEQQQLLQPLSQEEQQPQPQEPQVPELHQEQTLQEAEEQHQEQQQQQEPEPQQQAQGSEQQPPQPQEAELHQEQPRQEIEQQRQQGGEATETTQQQQSSEQGETEGRQEIVVAFYPNYREKKGEAYRGGNPYQDMLYSEFETAGVTLMTGEVLIDIIYNTEQMVSGKRNDVKKILHLHWLNLFVCKRSGEHARDRVAWLLRTLRFVKNNLGWKLVWTVHNVLSHRCDNQDVERELAQSIADLADVIHVLCEETVELVADSYQLPREKLLVVPHSSFVGAYVDYNIEQADARKALGFPPSLDESKTLVLLLGLLRPYKGVMELLDTFERIVPRETAADSNLMLFIVGALAGILVVIAASIFVSYSQLTF